LLDRLSDCVSSRWEYVTDVEASPLPVKDCKFLPMAFSEGSFYVPTPIMTRGLFLKVISMILTSKSQALDEGAIAIYFYVIDLTRMGFEVSNRVQHDLPITVQSSNTKPLCRCYIKDHSRQYWVNMKKKLILHQN
jgi:hypothetical protein